MTFEPNIAFNVALVILTILYVGIHPSCWTYSEGRREGSSPSVSPPRRARFPQDPETLQGQFIMLISVVGIRIKQYSTDKQII